MSTEVNTPNPQVALTLDDLSACQNLASTHITFSLTLACPLSCAHCIVDAGPDKGHTTMPIELANSFSRQMQGLAENGIEGICFTGGEPLLAKKQLSIMTNAATTAGISVSVVTAAHWAKTPEQAQKTVAKFPGISNWDVSFDSHHLPWVDITHIRNALDAIRKAERTATVRVTYSDPMTAEDRQVVQALEDIEETNWVGQGLRPVGRGTEIADNADHGWSPWIKPCLTQGMVVRYDGSVAPCCLNLVESRRHPFNFGDPQSNGLVSVHKKFQTDPLLQLIRTIGFSQIYDWIKEEGLTERLPNPIPEEVCSLCEGVMHDPLLAELAVKRANSDDTPLKIAILAEKTLGEKQMLETLGQAQPLKYFEKVTP